MVWSAAWLYKATGEDIYLQKAIDFYQEFDFEGATGAFLSWDDKLSAAQVLLAELTEDISFIQDAENACQFNIDFPRSPGGRTHFLQWVINSRRLTVS